MSRKIIGQGAARFEPDSQFGFLSTPSPKPPAGESTAKPKPGEIVMKKPVTRLTAFSLNDDLAHRLKIYAAENRVTASKIVTDLITDFLAGQGKN